MDKQKALTIWLTGLSAAGKTTLSVALKEALISNGYKSHILDGDVVRQGLSKDLGFSESDRSENIRRVAEVARLMNEAGVIVITALISPFRSDRDMAKAIVGSYNFREVYLSANLDVCKMRDPKKLYEKAYSGLIDNFTGVSAPYEAPQNADLVIETGRLSVHESISCLTHFTLSELESN